MVCEIFILGLVFLLNIMGLLLLMLVVRICSGIGVLENVMLLSCLFIYCLNLILDDRLLW